MINSTCFAFSHLLSVLAAVENHDLNAVGWTVMILSVGSVLTLAGFCLYRVLTLPPIEEKHLKAELQIDTRDTDDAD